MVQTRMIEIVSTSQRPTLFNDIVAEWVARNHWSLVLDTTLERDEVFINYYIPSIQHHVEASRKPDFAE